MARRSTRFRDSAFGRFVECAKNCEGGTPHLAVAVGLKAQEQGIAKLKKTGQALYDAASRKIKQSKAASGF